MGTVFTKQQKSEEVGHNFCGMYRLKLIIMLHGQSTVLLTQQLTWVVGASMASEL